MACRLAALVVVVVRVFVAGPVAAQDTTTSIVDTTTTTETTVPDTTTTTAVPETTTTEPAITTTTVSPTTTIAPTTTTTTPPVPCSPADPTTCDDGDPCTFDSCDGAFLECSHRPLDGPPCAADGIFCTDDHCVAGVCLHVPTDGRCDDGQCVVRVCDPQNPYANHAGCVLVKGRNKADGTPCTDDGFACTDDECMSGACLHMPVDQRCVPHDLCTAAACAPGDDGHDPDGCIVGPPRHEGDECADDADACTLDVCHAGGCTHVPDPNTSACAPVENVFQRTLALATLAEEIRAELPDGAALATALARLTIAENDLDAAARVLAGKPLMAPSVAAAPAEASSMTATERAHIAFTTVLRTPQAVSAFLQAVAQARVAQEVERPLARHLRRRGRVLLRSTRMLRAQLRVLQR